jgi:hypothetical protein
VSVPADPATDTPPAPLELAPAPDAAPADVYWVAAASDGASALGHADAAALVRQAPQDDGRVLNPTAAIAGLAVLLAWGAEPEEPRQRRQA